MVPIIPANISIPALPQVGGIQGASATGGSAFGSVLTDAISKVESFQNNATTSVNSFLSGDGEDLHKVALATQQADLSFQLFMQVQ